MPVILKILTVVGLAALEMYAAIPTGFAFKLPAWVIFFSSSAGGIFGVFIAVFLGEKIKSFIAKYRNPLKKIEKKDTLAHRIWYKYGVIGLGTLGTFFVGAPLCIAIGIGFNANIRLLIFYCCIGVLARCIVFTLAGHFGTKLF